MRDPWPDIHIAMRERFLILRVDDDEWDSIALQADALGITMANVVRRAVGLPEVECRQGASNTRRGRRGERVDNASRKMYHKASAARNDAPVTAVEEPALLPGVPPAVAPPPVADRRLPEKRPLDDIDALLAELD